MESRVIDLEIRLTHQEATLEELNEVLIRQQRVIDTLERQVVSLRDQLRAANAPGTPSEETPPPHY